MSDDLRIRVGCGDFEIYPDVSFDEIVIDRLLNKYIVDLEKIGSLCSLEIDKISATLLRDRYASKIQNFLVLIEKIQLANVNQSSIEKISLPSFPWLKLVETWANVDLSLSLSVRLKFMFKGLQIHLKLSVGLFLLLLNCIRDYILFRGEIKSSVIPDHILISPIHGNLREPYFKKVVDYCVISNKKVLLIGPSISSKKINYKISDSVQVESIEGVIPFRNLSILFFKVIYEFFRSLSIGKKEIERKLYKLIELDWKSSVLVRCTALVQIDSFMYFFTTFKKANLIQTFEGNPWEKTVQLALRTLGDKRKVMGYLHCAILRSHTKLLLGKGEFLSRPNPDMIVCTGENAKEVLLAFGDYPESRIYSGWAFREGLLAEIQIKKSQSKNVILLMLEGLMTMPLFLDVVLNSLEYLSGKKVIVRTHPIMRLSSSVFDKNRKHKNFDLLEESDIGDLIEDIQRAKFVLYQGTTASLYAAYLGCPLFRFKSKWWLSDDPLLNISKKIIPEFSNEIELVELLQRYENQILLTEEDKLYLKKYVEEYIKDPDSVDIETFLALSDKINEKTQ